MLRVMQDFGHQQYHVLQQNVVFNLGQPPLHVGSPISTVFLFYYCTILLFYYFALFYFYLFHSTYSTAAGRGRCLGLAARDAKKFLHRGQPLLDVGLVLPRTTTYYHVLPCTITYYHVLPRTNTYYQVLPRIAAERNSCISGSHPGPPLHVGYCFAILLFTPHTVLPRPMSGVGGPRCKKNLASRTATLRCRPRATAYYSTNRT